MNNLAKREKRQTKRPHDESQLPHPAAVRGIEAANFSIAANPFCEPQNILQVNPLATCTGRITGHKKPVCSFLVNCDSMQCKSSTSFIQYDASKVECAIRQRFNRYGFSILDGWIHARAQSLKAYRGIGAQKRFDDITSDWCRR